MVRALITYALDLILPPERSKPLASRRIEFDDLASELIEALMANTTHSDVVALALRLARCVPCVFRSRKTVLVDIAHIWRRTNEAIPEDYRERLNLHATDTFIAVAQHHVVTNGELPSAYGLYGHEASERRPGEWSQPTDDDLHDGHDPKPRYIDPAHSRHERDQGGIDYRCAILRSR